MMIEVEIDSVDQLQPVLAERPDIVLLDNMSLDDLRRAVGLRNSLAKEVEFDQAYIFKYSPRRDTPAATMPDQVSQAEKEERNQRLLQLINDIAARRFQKLVGNHVQILVEGPSKKNTARMSGRTRCNKIVVFEGSDRHRGQVMDVRIERAGSFTLYGCAAVVG